MRAAAVTPSDGEHELLDRIEELTLLGRLILTARYEGSAGAEFTGNRRWPGSVSDSFEDADEPQWDCRETQSFSQLAQELGLTKDEAQELHAADVRQLRRPWKCNAEGSMTSRSVFWSDPLRLLSRGCRTLARSNASSSRKRILRNLEKFCQISNLIPEY